MTDFSPPLEESDAPFRGRSEMAALMRAMDWAATPLGPVKTWSASLRTTVSTLLATRHAMFLWWGLDLIQFYNDAYRQSLGSDRHPSALGQRGRACWAEIWPIIGREVDAIMAGGEATWHEDHLVPITRGEHVHDVYWSYSYSPVLDDDSSVGGVLVIVQESTRRVIAERRLHVLQELVASMQHANAVAEVCRSAMAVLGAAPRDAAFALFYLNDPETGELHLAAWTGVEPGTPVAPYALQPRTDKIWPVAAAVAHAAAEPSTPVERVICDLWPEPVREALTVPLTITGNEGPSQGVLIIGLNPRLPLDRLYTDFIEQVAREITAAFDRLQRSAQERRLTLATARAERALLERVFELSPAFLAVLRGPRHIFELANPAYIQLVGHRSILGQGLMDALPELAGQGFVELLDNVYRTGEPFVGNELPVKLQLAPGNVLEARYVNFVYQPMRDASGTITSILVSGVDVTDLVHSRLEAERLAAERDVERRRLLTVLEQSPIAIAIAEAPTGRLVFLNRKIQEIFGHDRKSDTIEAYDIHYRGYHLDGRRLTSEEWAMARALTQGQIIEGEILEIEREDGERRTISINAAPVRDGNGHIIAGVVLLQDITTERRLERRLHDAQRLQSVGTLAGGVAHEVNNQMTVVLGFAAYVLRELGPDHLLAPDVRLVAQAGERAARISQQLLAFARQQPTQPRSTDVYALVTALAPVLRQLLGSDKELVFTNAARPSARANVDPSQVEQTLINLVANARDATSTGDRVTVALDHVELTAADGEARGFTIIPGGYIRLSVADTGHGMDAATLTRAFEPFFTTKPIGQGTGLGLSTVYGIVKQHGGYIWAESAPGSGTVVKLYWPAALEESAVSDPTPPPNRRDATQAPSLIALVVDDEDNVRRLVVRTLEGAGFHVLSAADGRQALQILAESGQPPDVVVTDIIMPHVNGRQLSDAIAAQHPHIPILFISGHAGHDVVMRNLLPEGAPFLQKPFTPDILVAAVQSLLLHQEDRLPS